MNTRKSILLRTALLGSPALLFGAALCLAGGIFATVRGVVRDPHHRPIEGAHVTLHTKLSDRAHRARTNSQGEFTIDAVPAGEYTVRVERSGFRTAEQDILVAVGSAPVLDFPMQFGTHEEDAEVLTETDPVSAELAALATRMNRDQFEHAAGASVAHDQLHLRGDRRVRWMMNGGPVPYANATDNIGPQFDLKEISAFDSQRGGYSGEYGDPLSGMSDAAPRPGFGRGREVEVVASLGSFGETNDQISFSGHAERFAYYAGVNANRTGLALATPIRDVLHDHGSGLGGFASLTYNATPADQLRLVTSLRADSYQIPNTRAEQRIGFRDEQSERDAFVNFSWIHASGPGILLTLSPFYHFNRAAFDSGPVRPALVAASHRATRYAGGQATLTVVRGKHNARAGLFALAQRDAAFFRPRGRPHRFVRQERVGGHRETFFVEDQYRLTAWLTLSGGIRLTHFDGKLTENAASPRAGVALRIPRLGWVLRGYYARSYEAPPLSTISFSMLTFAQTQGFGFVPLPGERDEQHEFGLTIPVRRWAFDFAEFHTGMRNTFGHDVFGNSNIFFPLTIAHARIHGWEATVRSPLIARRGSFHLNYTHQESRGQGPVTGGLTSFRPPAGRFFFLDHDQRDALGLGLEFELPSRAWVSSKITYGSGLLDGDGPRHLLPHTSLDFSVGKWFGENLVLQFTALNLTDTRFFLDRKNSFSGTHLNDPRTVSLQVRYRLHF